MVLSGLYRYFGKVYASIFMVVEKRRLGGSLMPQSAWKAKENVQIMLKMEVKTSLETSMTRYHLAEGNTPEDLCSDLPSSRHTGGCINLLKPAGYVMHQ
jgi:hypothetical protein